MSTVDPAQRADCVRDLDEQGRPVSPRYERLGARGANEEGLYVRFSPGFGLNVYVGHRRAVYKGGRWSVPSGYEDGDDLALSIGGWEKLCALVDEYRAREAELNDGQQAP